MNPLYRNPVFVALTGRDSHLSLGSKSARYFDAEVSPFAAFEEGNSHGFEELHDLLPRERKILFATPDHISVQAGWELIVKIEGVQMVHNGTAYTDLRHLQPVHLGQEHIEQMISLTRLTKPGPFGQRTIEFGHYYGIMDKGELVAMTGQRLHLQDHTEVSAVCTHPDHLGKGYASLLLQHQVALIHDQGQTPFLHVRADNQRAIDIYQRYGFDISGVMNFYFMKTV